jgi:hypothetical protein
LTFGAGHLGSFTEAKPLEGAQAIGEHEIPARV